MELNAMYAKLGVSPAVYEFGEKVLKDLRERFDAIDQVAEYNQAKVLHAMQKNRRRQQASSPYRREATTQKSIFPKG